MSVLSIQPTYPIFTETNGLPLENGYIWLGAANLDPQGNPINVYWDAALTIPAGQPIRTLNGYPSRSGTPARLYVNSDYSIRVQNSKGSMVYSAPAATERYSDVVFGANSNQVIYTPPFPGSVSTTVQDKLSENISLGDFGLVAENTPFNKTGVRLVAGERNDAHCAWGSIVEILGSTKWVMIYRKGTMHGIEDGTEVRAADSYDFGLSWQNDRQIQYDATTDSRSDKLAVMANGRIGFFCNRTSSAGPNKYPLFISSDDQGVTWNKLEVPTSSLSYTFASVGGIIDFPSSQGGNDDTGFITFGYINATGLDAFTTTNNGNTWSTVYNVTGSTVVSENVVIRLGNTDRWLCYIRNATDVLVYATNNLLMWGTSSSAGITSNSTPPGGFYDEATDKVYYIATSRAGREIDGYGNNFLYVNEDANTLWNSRGVFSSAYKSLLTAPNWTTGYFHTFNSKLGLGAVFTAGENVSNGNPPSSVWMVGDFDINGADVGMFVDKYTRNMNDVNSLGLKAIDNDIFTYVVTISNASKTTNNYFGAYTTSYNMGGASHSIYRNFGDFAEYFDSTAGNVEYEFRNTGTTRYNGSNLLFGVSTTANINGENANIQSRLNSSTSPSIRTAALGTSSSRKHFVVHHDAGSDISVCPEVGSISSTTTATAFNTTSDETWKSFIGNYDGQQAIDIIKSDPVREFHWKQELGGGYAVGWGAQTSYAISKELAFKGGWYKDDIEVPEGTDGAVYVPWGVDQSKRTPYLWAAVSLLVDKLAQAEARIIALETKNG